MDASEESVMGKQRPCIKVQEVNFTKEMKRQAMENTGCALNQAVEKFTAGMGPHTCRA